MTEAKVCTETAAGGVEMNPYLAKHLAISDKLLALIDRALDDPRELFTTVVRKKSTKTDEEEVYGVERDTIDEKKLCAVVTAVSDLKDIQRQALGFLDEKDRLRFAADQSKSSGEGLGSFLKAMGMEAKD